MAEEGTPVMPIFELPLVILPGERIPLHIFEQRYQRMIGHCLLKRKPFGIVFRDDAGARSTGCGVEVAEVVERFEDGRLNILVDGLEPFAVLERFEAEAWPAGRVRMLATDAATDGADAEAAEAAFAAFAELLETVGSDGPNEPPADAYAIASHVELATETKQALLEERSEAKRLRLLTSALEELKVTIERSRRVAEVARSNGHSPPGSSAPRL